MEAIFLASHRTKGLSLPQGVRASGDWKPHVPHLKGSLWVISVLQLVGHHHTLLFWFSDNSGGIYTSLPYCMCATKWINWKQTNSVPWSRGTRYKTKSPHWEAELSHECLSNWGMYMCRRGLKYVITGHLPYSCGSKVSSAGTRRDVIFHTVRPACCSSSSGNQTTVMTFCSKVRILLTC